MRPVVIVLVLALGCSRSSTGTSTSAIASDQMVTAIIDDWSSTHATLRLWHRDGTWKPVGEPWPATIGSAGAAWGAGLHGVGAPSGRTGPVKREGDRKSPAGMFALRGAYGYAAAAPPGTRLPYTQVDTPSECIDDPESPHYAQIVERGRVAADWKSSEMLRRADDLYTWVVDIAHNPARTPGAGSCIFLHVWAGPDVPTVGCTAMAEPQLAHLLATLEPSATFVLLPRGEYRALAAPWGLPPQ